MLLPTTVITIFAVWLLFAINPANAFTNFINLPDGTLTYGKICKSSELSGKCEGDFTQNALANNKPVINVEIYDIQAVSETVYKITIEVRTEATMSFDALKQLRFTGLLTPNDYISGQEYMYYKDGNIKNIDDPSHFAFTLLVTTVPNGDQVCTPTFQIQYEWCAWDTTTSECSSWEYSTDYWYYSDCPASQKDIQPICWDKLCAEGYDPSASTTLTEVQTETTTYTEEVEESTLTTVTSTVTPGDDEGDDKTTTSKSAAATPQTPGVSTLTAQVTPQTPGVSTLTVQVTPQTPGVSTLTAQGTPQTPGVSTLTAQNSPATPEVSTFSWKTTVVTLTESDITITSTFGTSVQAIAPIETLEIFEEEEFESEITLTTEVETESTFVTTETIKTEVLSTSTTLATVETESSLVTISTTETAEIVTTITTGESTFVTTETDETTINGTPTTISNEEIISSLETFSTTVTEVEVPKSTVTTDFTTEFTWLTTNTEETTILGTPTTIVTVEAESSFETVLTTFTEGELEELPYVTTYTTEVPEYTDEVFTLVTTISDEIIVSSYTTLIGNNNNNGQLQGIEKPQVTVSGGSTFTIDAEAITTVTSTSEYTAVNTWVNTDTIESTLPNNGGITIIVTETTNTVVETEQTVVTLTQGGDNGGNTVVFTTYTVDAENAVPVTSIYTLSNGAVTTSTGQLVADTEVISTTFKSRVPEYKAEVTTDVETETFKYASKRPAITLTGYEAAGYGNSIDVSTVGVSGAATDAAQTGGAAAADSGSWSSAAPTIASVTPAEGNGAFAFRVSQNRNTALFGMLCGIFLTLML